MITSIISLPAKGHLKERYVTTGKDGTFRFWQAKVVSTANMYGAFKCRQPSLITVVHTNSRHASARCTPAK